jgi:hypothetical protein
VVTLGHAEIPERILYAQEQRKLPVVPMPFDGPFPATSAPASAGGLERPPVSSGTE